MDRKWEFVAVWEFRVRPEAIERFEAAYGPNGEWAALFRQSSDFIETSLERDPHDPFLFRTLDYWTSREAYEQFRKTHAAEYRAIDQRCEELTENESEIGQYDRVDFERGV